MKTILLTGAGGGVGTFMRAELKGRYQLRLSDRGPLAERGPDEEFVQADLTDIAATRNAVAGVDGIIHLGGYSVEADWDTIHTANFIGTYNLYEAARLEGAKRVIFASSNHAVGFHDRTNIIDHTTAHRPDSRYGLSKAFGESLSSLYADKYGVESMCIRIGNVGPEPIDVRRLSIWLSPRDLAQLVCIGLDHPDIKHEIVYGMSDNARSWWDNSNATRLGYKPQDKSEDFAEQILATKTSDTGNLIGDLKQGGDFVTFEAFDDPFKPGLK